jgi:hypothetical protein
MTTLEAAAVAVGDRRADCIADGEQPDEIGVVRNNGDLKCARSGLKAAVAVKLIDKTERPWAASRSGTTR